MAIKLRKKAIFFTFIAISLAALLLFSYYSYTEYRLSNKMSVIETRVDTINHFIKNIEIDLNKGLYISSFRTILALEEFIVKDGNFLDNVTIRFREAMINGTVNGSSVSLIEDASFTDWGKKIQGEALKVGIIMNFSINNLEIYQTNPWAVEVNASVTLNISDVKNTARWMKNYSLKTTVPIADLEDPVYAVYSYGRVANKIRLSPYKDDLDNTVNLKMHINGSYYIESANGPSFLMRLEGNLNSSPSGIESIVNKNRFVAQGLSTKTKSFVDYIYFSNVSTSHCQVNETKEDESYNWFRIDSGTEPYDHRDDYSVVCG